MLNLWKTYLGPFIAHDEEGNDPSNYKLVRWSDIADNSGPQLIIDNTFNAQ